MLFIFTPTRYNIHGFYFDNFTVEHVIDATFCSLNNTQSFS